ncbi:C3 and PZP-like alpha-2-macroglobulin domain-containing protein 8 isoform X3 [Biomphalaria glabrata]|nr:C3 and PZP-like alpha-2-macroglobulin domain-containing protein 8 isoform X3 [Biomphalaria glabrata]
MWHLICSTILIAMVSAQQPGGGPPREDNCLIDASVGCSYARAPQYLVITPKKIRPNQVFQIFATILKMEYNQEFVHVIVSIIKDNIEYANTALRFDRPSSRIMQLQMPSNAQEGKYRLRVEGRLNEQDTGNIWQNETDIDFTTKQASLFLQMSRPLYRQGQKVHFRIIPILPNMMPKYGSMVIYVDDPTGIPVRRWQSIQTNAGGIISQSFTLSDQPNFGTWIIRVEAFGHVYRHPFTVEDFWEPRFDVNVSVPSYVMETPEISVAGVMLANHTSGRPCIGNASITAFFRPREEIWNRTKGWEKPYWDAQAGGTPNSGVPMELPQYKPVHTIPVKDYYMYFAYEYRFIDYFQGRIDFEWTLEQLMTIAKRGGESGSLVDSEFVFFANVSDWYSGLNRTGWAGTIFFDSKIKLKWVGDQIRTFKPSQVMRVQVAVTKYDGTPVENVGTVTLTDVTTDSSGTAVQSKSNTQVPKNGIADFEYQLSATTQTLKLTATYADARKPYSGDNKIYLDPRFNLGTTVPITMYATRYYSPSNSYITILTSTDRPQVNEYMVFHVKTSNYVPRIYYQIVAQSNIIIGDWLEMTSRQKTFAVALSRDMVPTARLVVYYIRQPEEIVVDVLNFFVNGTRQNLVTLNINRGKDFSRDTIEFNAYADPGSYVSFSGMLLDLYSRGLSDGITENKLIDELMTYDSTQNGSYRHLWRVSDTEYEYVFYHGPDYGIDANTSFDTAGLLVLTDARVSRLYNDKFCTDQKSFPCFVGIESQCFKPEQRCDGTIDCVNDGADEWGCTFQESKEIHNPAMDRVSRVMRFYDNSSWAWQEIFVKPDGRVDFRVDVPKYPLSWVINGVSVSRELGLGIMLKPVRYDAARYMYMQVEHPKHIIRGEQVGVRVTVFNYWYDDDYLEVLITMHGGDGYSFVTVGEYGYVTSYTPPTHKGDHQTIVFLEPGESKDIYMPIVPDGGVVRGQIEFKVSASCFMQKDEYIGTMYVKPDGVMNYYHTPYLIDLIRFGSIQIPQFDVPVPEQFRKLEVRENLYIPQSPEAVVSLFGDVVTPGFFQDYLNAENILWRPYGGGEMIVFNFAYNLYSLKFMKYSQQLDDAQLSKSLQEMNIAFQRILSYMNATDGSFKMFRDDPKPSLWLSAFVVKIVKEATFGEWERDLFMPRELINKVVLYICSRQNETTGAFEPDDIEATYDRKMTLLESLKGDKLHAHPIPLTAYVLIALSDLQNYVSEEAAACRDTAVRNAANYLFNIVPEIKEVFHMAITTYALSLTQKRSPFETLWKMKRNDSDFLYFSEETSYENPYDFLNNVRYLKPRQELMNDAHAVQATAYALMAHMNSNLGTKVEREMMMAWLNTMRNSIGGFAATQDTILAMEALLKFTQVDPHRNVFDLSTTVESTSSPSWAATFNLKKLDYIRLKTNSLPADKVWGFIVPNAQGTGRALLQLTTTVNVEYMWLQKKPMRPNNDPNEEPIKFFDLIVEDLRFSGRNDSIMEMTNCVSWLYTEKSLTSGLAVLEVDIPTGYVVMNDTLRDYVRSNRVPSLKRAEHYDRKVIFYFEYLDESKTCVYFRADRWFPVANATIQHRMRVYDYYEPGMHNTTLYTTRNLFLLNICFVCGSYQCPYCPYFNSATIMSAGFSVVLLMAATYFVQRLLLRNR